MKQKVITLIAKQGAVNALRAQFKETCHIIKKDVDRILGEPKDRSRALRERKVLILEALIDLEDLDAAINLMVNEQKEGNEDQSE